MCVHSQKDEHEEEADSPKLRQRHHGSSLRVGDEGQSWTCGGGQQRALDLTKKKTIDVLQ